MSSMPSCPMSSSRPTKGLMYRAPALAASRAWLALKQSVTLTGCPASLSVLQACRPAGVSGTFTTMFSAISRSQRPSRIIPSASVETVSPEMSPGQIAQISASTSRMSRPDLAMRLGLVVTPSMMPMSWRAWISWASAVSAKIFMGWTVELRFCENGSVPLSPFVLSLSKHDRGSPFDKPSMNGTFQSRLFPTKKSLPESASVFKGNSRQSQTEGGNRLRVAGQSAKRGGRNAGCPQSRG